MDSSTKTVVALDPEMPSHLAIAKILRHVFYAMEENESAWMANSNADTLHDFRVAIRRARTALGQFREMLSAAATAHFCGEFAWLGRLTGPVRDLDVYLINLAEYQHTLPPHIQENLWPLHTFLTCKREGAHRMLMQQLQSSRYLRFKQDWREFLDDGFSENSETLAINMANRCIARLFRHVLREGGAIQKSSPPEALHELRKSCRKLRYLIEFFRIFYLHNEVSMLLARLKHLQDKLGEIHDLAIEYASLESFRKEMSAEGNLSEACDHAMKILVENLRQRQSDARLTFAACFAEFTVVKLDGISNRPLEQ